MNESMKTLESKEFSGDILHRKLIVLQSTEELKRKADKAFTRKYWTQEELDYAERWGDEVRKKLNW